MEVNFSVGLKIIQSTSLVNPSEIQSYLKGGGFDDNDFKIENLHQKVIEVPAGGSISSIDVFDFFGLVSEDVTFVHIQVYNTEPDNFNLNDIRFSIDVGSVGMGDMSQFTLANMKNFTSD